MFVSGSQKLFLNIVIDWIWILAVHETPRKDTRPPESGGWCRWTLSSIIYLLYHLFLCIWNPFLCSGSMKLCWSTYDVTLPASFSSLRTRFVQWIESLQIKKVEVSQKHRREAALGSVPWISVTITMPSPKLQAIISSSPSTSFILLCRNRSCIHGG